jgi:hypothetical protein
MHCSLNGAHRLPFPELCAPSVVWTFTKPRPL